MPNVSKAEMNGKQGANIMKYLQVPFEVKSFGEDDEYFTFEGYASTFGNVDFGDDRVMKGAFIASIAKCMSGKKIPVLWQHDAKMPLGIYTELSEDNTGLLVKGRMPKADDFVRTRVMPQMKAGSISAMSIGYIVRDYDFDGDVRQLKQVDLFEISLVTMPMNEEAVITGMKAAKNNELLPIAPKDYAWNAEEAKERVQEFTGNKAALFNLNISDVVDDELKAVPQAIFDAALSLPSSDMPDEHKECVAEVINRYYKAMGMEAPLKKQFVFSLSKDEMEYLKVKDVEQLLRNGVKCSLSVAKAMAINVGNLRDVEKTTLRDAETFVKSLQGLSKTLQKDS